MGGVHIVGSAFVCDGGCECSLETLSICYNYVECNREEVSWAQVEGLVLVIVN